MAAFSDVDPESISSLPLLSWAAPHPTSSPSPTDAQGAERVGCGGGEAGGRGKGEREVRWEGYWFILCLQD